MVNTEKIKLLFIIIIVSILFSTESNACDCSKISTVKANMHTFQTIVETYFKYHKEYPSNIQILFKDANQPIDNNYVYWKDFQNPQTKEWGYRKSFHDYEKWLSEPKRNLEFKYGLRILKPLKNNESYIEGMVLYKFISKSSYQILGTNKNGELVKDKNREFYLSNES